MYQVTNTKLIKWVKINLTFPNGAESMRDKALSIKNEENLVMFNYVQLKLFSLKPNNYDVVRHKFYL